MALLSNYFNQKREDRRAQIYRALLQHEAKVGGTLFGPTPEGHRREFFCMDEHTWVWHEEWQDMAGAWQSVTSRYDVRPSGVLKSQGGAAYQPLSEQELDHFHQAVQLYGEKLGSEYRGMLQAA